MTGGAPADGTALYRIRGENALLLYIGVSDDFGRRRKEHAKKQPWWGERRSLSVDRWYDSRAEAEEAEAAAIKAEKPKYNKAHNARRSRRRVTVDPYPMLASAIAVRESPRWEVSPDSMKGFRVVGSGGQGVSKALTGGCGGSC